MRTDPHSSHESCWSRHSSCHYWRTWGWARSRTNRLGRWRECAQSNAVHLDRYSSEDADKSMEIDFKNYR